MDEQAKTTDLTPGSLYRVKWRHHYNRHQVDPGLLGKFLNWRPKHDSLHGEFMHQEAIFQRQKESGKASYMFGVNPSDVDILKVSNP